MEDYLLIFIDEQVYVSTYEASVIFTYATIPHESSYQQYCKATLHTVSWESATVTKECMSQLFERRMIMSNSKRRDNKGRVLQMGESHPKKMLYFDKK